MKGKKMNFGELLTQGLDSIQRIESQDERKKFSEIEIELAESIRELYT